jgi:hypothetical protein
MEERRKRWFLFLIIVVLILSVAPQIVRLLSVIHFYDMHVNTGIEGINFYNIWRVVNHHPLYTDPWTPPFSVTLYNFGFYWTYGLVARMLGVNDAGIMLLSRLLSLAFAIGGAGVTFALVQLAFKRMTNAARLVAGMLAIIAWLGLNSTVWWAMSTRPDMESCAFALLGCYLYARHLRGKSTGSCILAGFSFGLAWACKQSTIWSAGGCFFFALLIRKRYREAAYLAVPGILVVSLVWLFAPVAYWQNIIGGPSVDYVVLRLTITRTLEVFLPNVAFFIIPVLVLSNERLRRRLFVQSESEFNVPVIRLIYFVSAIALVMGLLAIGRTGTSRNQLFEPMFAMAVLCTICCIECFFNSHLEEGRSITRMRRMITCALLVMLVLPACTLARPRIDAGPLHWHLTWMNDSSYARRRQLALEIRRLPRPLFIRDEVLELPWNSSDDSYPAQVNDWPTYWLAKRAGRLHGSLESVVAARHFATLVLTPDDPVLSVAKSGGYSVKSACEHAVGAMGEEETLLILSR